ncbi:BlaI/MecI/CopY family transcriptional regulator [Verrucomicrobiota bacterium]
MKTKNHAADSRQELSRSEWLIMQEVWKAVETEEEVAISEILPGIQDRRKWHVSTLKTMMDRLVKKGFLTNRIRGKTCFYKPAKSKNQTVKKSLMSYLDTVLDGVLDPLVAYMADQRGLSKKEIQALEELIKEKKK